ncbi:MAG: proline--tRNA ligase, partial [Planctomycetes bacterium]|nr:proline--tRNA ligase [Planctomycetota bacterium]
GMIWPLPIAPYAVHLVQMKAGNEAQDALAQEIHDKLEESGVDVLWDERKKVSPGAKFKDADLIGVPIRIVVGRDAGDRKIEWGLRDGEGREVRDADEAIVAAIQMVQESRR